MKLQEILWWWGPVVGLCGLIFWLSSTPNLEVGSGATDTLLRKSAHMMVYGALFLLVYRALLRNVLSVWSSKTAILAACLALAYALSDELHQTFVPTRNGNWLDIGFDLIGITVAAIGLAWWGWWNRVLSETKLEKTED